jgi:hypothetical protein
VSGRVSSPGLRLIAEPNVSSLAFQVDTRQQPSLPLRLGKIWTGAPSADSLFRLYPPPEPLEASACWQH